MTSSSACRRHLAAVSLAAAGYRRRTLLPDMPKIPGESRTINRQSGLRYEAHTPWVEQNNLQDNYNIATGNIDFAGQNGASRALYNGFYGGKDFQPRLGFAYTPGWSGGQRLSVGRSPSPLIWKGQARTCG